MMSSNALFILLLILFDGAAVAWGVWEVLSTRTKTARKVEDTTTISPSAPASPEGARHPEG